jgi:hypothetical protein
MATFTVEIKNLAQIVKAIGNIDQKLVKPSLRRSIRLGAKYFLQLAKEFVPIRSGFLRKSLKLKAGKRKKDHLRLNVFSGGSGGNSFGGKSYYGSFVNLGSVHNNPPNEFLTQAYRVGRDRVVELVRSGLIADLQRFRG